MVYWGSLADTFRANGQREDLSDENPGGGAPGCGEEEYVETGEDDEARGCGLATLIDCADNGDEKFADEHAKGAVDQECASTQLLDSPERDGRGADVDCSGDHGDGKGVRQANSLEEGGAVVCLKLVTIAYQPCTLTLTEDEVDTSPLLKHLQGDTEHDAT